MSTILIVDDREDVRKIVSDLVILNLPEKSNWEVSSIPPLKEFEDYNGLITQDDVSVMVVDERLHEQNSGEAAVNYNGHELVEYLRKYFPDLPIFVVTAVSDEELDKRKGDVEDVIDRKTFVKDAEMYVSRITRSGAKFASAFKEQLSTLSKLAEKSAQGIGTPEEADQMRVIRQSLSIAFPEPETSKSAELIPKAEDLISRAKTLVDQLKSKK